MPWLESGNGGRGEWRESVLVHWEGGRGKEGDSNKARKEGRKASNLCGLNGVWSFPTGIILLGSLLRL